MGNRTRRGAPPFVALLEFIAGAYLRASLLHSAGADLLLLTRYKLHDLRRMRQCRVPVDAAEQADARVAGVILIRQRRNIHSVIVKRES